jgi:hypothetical protein
VSGVVEDDCLEERRGRGNTVANVGQIVIKVAIATNAARRCIVLVVVGREARRW